MFVIGRTIIDVLIVSAIVVLSLWAAVRALFRAWHGFVAATGLALLLFFLQKSVDTDLGIYGMLFLSFATLAVVEWMACRRSLRHPWARTPFDRCDAEPLLGSSDKEYDIFFSYKSEDIQFVRPVAELLMAAGVRVWIAEYAILLIGREEFQKAIDAAISNSRHAVVFTRPSYFRSPHCTRELELVSDRLLDVGKILHVQIQGYNETPNVLMALPAEDRLEVRAEPGRDHAALRQTCEFILSRLPLGSANIPWILEIPEPKSRSFKIGKWSFAIDLAGWKVDPLPFLGGQSFERWIDGYRLVGDVTPGKERITKRAASRTQIMPVDDRQCFESTMKFARSYLRLKCAKLVGVHLLYQNKLSHLGLTYWLRSGWIRRYSIVFRDPTDFQNDVEFAFTFTYFGPFSEFCKCAHMLDRVVRSLRFP
ncbi:MAG: toll/interleukin-1 receptor domain-containing protein [Planctomycetes bacterium]|nr:toll/interleukin-1 receptor domain-containing protein [Planctomycetota bacterium]